MLSPKQQLNLFTLIDGGPSLVYSRDDYRYYISYVDDHIRYTWIYPLKLKSEASEVFKLVKTLG